MLFTSLLRVQHLRRIVLGSSSTHHLTSVYNFPTRRETPRDLLNSCLARPGLMTHVTCPEFLFLSDLKSARATKLLNNQGP